MNEQLQKFARDELKKGLAQLPKSWQHRFKQMYAPKGQLDLAIDKVVDQIPVDHLDWAMTQTKNSVKKIDEAI